MSDDMLAIIGLFVFIPLMSTIVFSLFWTWPYDDRTQDDPSESK